MSDCSGAPAPESDKRYRHAFGSAQNNCARDRALVEHNGKLADPVLELPDVNGALIRSNDNWRSDQEAEIVATGLPPTNDLESAIVQNLATGSYTAIVRGVHGTTGSALVEVYVLN